MKYLTKLESIFSNGNLFLFNLLVACFQTKSRMEETVIITNYYMNITENNFTVWKNVQNDPLQGSSSSYLLLTLKMKRPKSCTSYPSVTVPFLCPEHPSRPQQRYREINGTWALKGASLVLEPLLEETR